MRVRSPIPGKRTGGNVTRTSRKTNVSNFTSALRPLHVYILTTYVQVMSWTVNEIKQTAIFVVKGYNTTQTEQGAGKSPVCN